MAIPLTITPGIKHHSAPILQSLIVEAPQGFPLYCARSYAPGPWPERPLEVDTRGYWKQRGRRVKKDAPVAGYCVAVAGSIPGGVSFSAHWVPAYHVEDTVPV